jgi:hypothetical protein
MVKDFQRTSPHRVDSQNCVLLPVLEDCVEAARSCESLTFDEIRDNRTLGETPFTRQSREDR